MRASRWVMVALFVVSAVLVVEAQQPRPGGGGFAVNVYNAVLTNKDLQEELKVTDAQKEKFKTSADKLSEFNKGAFEIFKNAGGDKDKLKEALAERTKETEKINADIKKSVEEVLTPDQKKRLEQIAVQARGIRAFADEKIAKDLNISEAQATKIKAITDEYTKDLQELGGGFGKGGGGKGGFDKEKAAENAKKREKLLKAAHSDIEEALTADQKSKWKEMTGAPFDTSKLRQGGFGFGGGGGFGKGGNKNKTKD